MHMYKVPFFTYEGMIKFIYLVCAVNKKEAAYKFNCEKSIHNKLTLIKLTIALNVKFIISIADVLRETCFFLFIDQC